MKMLVINTQSEQQLQFRYFNWRGEDHTYLVHPESIEFGPYTEQGLDRTNQENNWVLHAQEIERDGVPRDVGRRTFLLRKVRPL